MTSLPRSVLLLLLVLLLSALLGAVLVRPALTVAVPVAQADAIVLLSGATSERAPEAVRLYQEGRAPVIILTDDGVLSRWSRRYQRNLYNIEWARDYLVSAGVNPSRIIMLPHGNSGTIFEAFAVRELVTQNGMKSLILVTSDYHSRRALWTFRHVFRQDRITLGMAPTPSGSHSWWYDTCFFARHAVTELVKAVYYLVLFQG